MFYTFLSAVGVVMSSVVISFIGDNKRFSVLKVFCLLRSLCLPTWGSKARLCLVPCGGIRSFVEVIINMRKELSFFTFCTSRGARLAHSI
jgi:hypothetical protein